MVRTNTFLANLTKSPGTFLFSILFFTNETSFNTTLLMDQFEAHPIVIVIVTIVIVMIVTVKIVIVMFKLKQRIQAK